MRAWLRERVLVQDALLAGSLFTLGLAGLWWGSEPASHDGRTVLGVILLVGLFVPLVWRRRHPRLVVVIVAAAAVAVWSTGYSNTPTGAAGAIAFYGLGRYLDRPGSVRAFLVISGVLAAAAVWVALARVDPTPWVSLAGRAGVVLWSFWFGDAQRSHAALLDSLRERAARTEAERAEAERRAVLEERARITRELHDIVAHSVSVMVVQSTAAARLIGRDTDRAVASIGNVTDVGRAALREMRRMLGVLDADAGPTDHAPQPGLAELEAIVDRCRSAGFEVTVAQEGTPSSLSAGLELSVVRIVQECLTNVMKHAGPAHAQVRLSFADAVIVEVVDDGGGEAAAGSPEAGSPGAGHPGSGSPGAGHPGNGRGLIGMRQRVEALGGRLEAGPRAAGGFAVRAVIPLETAVDPPVAAAGSPAATRAGASS